MRLLCNISIGPVMSCHNRHVLLFAYSFYYTPSALKYDHSPSFLPPCVAPSVGQEWAWEGDSTQLARVSGLGIKSASQYLTQDAPCKCTDNAGTHTHPNHTADRKTLKPHAEKGSGINTGNIPRAIKRQVYGSHAHTTLPQQRVPPNSKDPMIVTLHSATSIKHWKPQKQLD